MHIVIESAKTLNPLSVSIANGISKVINSIFRVIEANRYSKANQFDDLIRAMKMEYPYESEDFIRHRAHAYFKNGTTDV